jgi:hypothetical protein
MEIARDSGEEFGDLLRRYRTVAELTQEELAERAAISARSPTRLSLTGWTGPHSSRPPAERPHRPAGPLDARRPPARWGSTCRRPSPG